MIRRFRRVFLAALALGFLAPLPAVARTVLVRQGGSIRAALADAQRGDRIEVMPGVYHEGAPGDLNALTVTIDGIQLVGRPRPGHPVVLENPGGQAHGIWVSPIDSTGPVAEAEDERPPCGFSGATIKGFALSGFTVRGFLRHGAHLACVDGFALTDNVSDGNQFYGFFPVVSRSGVLAGNEVMNTGSDAAIYVGQSDSVLITGNRVHGSLLGIEVQNSRHCAVIGNDLHDNTLGIFVDVGSDKILKTQETTLVSLNWVHNNNRPNSAEPEDFLALLPSGIGVFLVGADTTTVFNNTVERNGFVGIGVATLCLGLALQGQPCVGLDVDPFADDNRIIHNRVRGNGTVPNGNPLLDMFRADLFWDETGTGNCWGLNSYAAAVPPILPKCP
jgi:parallel beta-helix repeat protein